LVDVPRDPRADPALVKEYGFALRRRVVALKDEYNVLEYTCALEKEPDLRSAIALAMDFRRLQTTPVWKSRPAQMLLGGRLLISECWGIHERENIGERGKAGELMSRPRFEQVLNYAHARESPYCPRAVLWPSWKRGNPSRWDGQKATTSCCPIPRSAASTPS
jgi:hypothetical protein